MTRELDIIALQTRRMTLSDSMMYLINDFTHELEGKTADFIIMPEKWIDEVFEEDSLNLKKIIRFFQEFTEKNRATIIPGSFSVKRDEGVFNSAPVISRGEILGWQDKISLFSREKESYTPGTEAKLFELPGLKFTVSICYDSDFPYYSRLAAINGSEIMFNPALIHKDFHDMWKIYVEARALENRLPFVSVNSLSDPFGGGSMISVPEKYLFGAKLKTRTYGEKELITEKISLDGISELREARLEEDPGSYGLREKKAVY